VASLRVFGTLDGAAHAVLVRRANHAIIPRLPGSESPPAMKLAKYVKFREEKFGGVVFETRSEKVYTLNSTGAAVVREIEAGIEECDIPDRLREHFRDNSGAIAREAVAFIADLRQKGLVED
jgi:hypothetical protein